jgi:hypothetical protein
VIYVALPQGVSFTGKSQLPALQNIPQPPQRTANPDGAISLSDGAGDVVDLQYINGNPQTALMPGSGLGLSDLSGLESELQPDGSTIVPPDLLNAGALSRGARGGSIGSGRE